MNCPLLISLIAVNCATSAAIAADDDLEVWTSSDGKYSTEATLLGTEMDADRGGMLLVLKKKSGAIIKVSLDQLSNSSKQLASRILAQRRSAATMKDKARVDDVSQHSEIAGLAQQDRQTLTANLKALSAGWVQEAVDSANPILWKPEYKAQHWQAFFSSFFSANSFTEDLRNYLGYPIFGWGPESAHAPLQEGIARALEELLVRLVKPHGNDLGAALNTDPVLLETLCKATLFVNSLAGSKDLGADTRERLYRLHLDLIGGSRVLPVSNTIDVSAYPYLGRIRAQLCMNLVDLALQDVSDPKELTLRILPKRRKDEIARALSLGQHKLRIWQTHSLLVMDNNGLDAAQLSAIDRLLTLAPPELHNLGVVTVREFLGKDVDFYKCSVGYVNIGGVRIGQAKENGFPDDVLPAYSDVFWLIWVHEFNHVVDYYYVKHDNPSRNRLIEQAGRVSLNYLRSMFGDDVFVNSPQEFFASISNQYFADSNRTLELALMRFDKGFREPLRQFLFFADVYSRKGNRTFFYRIDTQGNIDRQTVELTRDDNGFINGLKTNRREFRFTRDIQGVVIKYW